MDGRVVATAHKYWQAGRAPDAGRVLYESMATEQRPAWAAAVLAFAYRCTEVARTPEIEEVLRIARTPVEESWRWFDASAAFSAVRSVTLRVHGQDALYDGVLSVAENVAKVTFNAYAERVASISTTSYPGPPRYDHDAGWRVASDLYAIVTRLNDTGLASEAWSVLSGGADPDDPP